jgi:hypothetical protein
MRFSTVAMVLSALLTAGVANAAEGPKGAGDTGKGGGGPGGGAGSGNVESSGAGESAGTRSDNPDYTEGLTTAYKPWEVGVVFTTHRLIDQGDQQIGMPDPTGNGQLGDPAPVNPGSGNGINKQVNDYELYVRYDLTKNDRVGVRAYVFEYFLADQGESGVRFDDMVLSYQHTFQLPKRFRLQAGAWAILPTSFTSQLEGLVVGLRPTLSVDRRFGPVSVTLRTYDTAFIERYDSYAGSGGYAPTELNSLAFTSDIEMHMPFHEPLSVGVGAFVGYTWYNNIQSGIGGNSPTCPSGSSGTANPACTSGNSTKDNNGLVRDGTFPTQPIQETYGWEAYVRYLLPDLFGFKSDLTAAYSFGDPTVGYSSLLQDGVGHVYLGYYHNSEVYLSMAVRY